MFDPGEKVMYHWQYSCVEGTIIECACRYDTYYVIDSGRQPKEVRCFQTKWSQEHAIPMLFIHTIAEHTAYVLKHGQCGGYHA